MFPVFQPESPQAQAIYDVFLQVLWISAGIFFIVTALIVIALFNGRKKRDLPEQDFGSHKKEIFWMVGPTLIVLWLAAISTKLILTMDAVPKAHPARSIEADAELTVIGHQWWWEVKYNGSGVTGANEIHIPSGKKIRVKLQSADVIHSFWVPQLARKMDVIPGRHNYIWLEANQPGTYQGRCAEYCGNQHAWMNFKVYSHTPDEYEKWLNNESVEPPASDLPDAVAGKELFFSQTCVNCHAIQGTEAIATIGPDLTFVARRKELGGGVIKNSSRNLALWLKNPEAIKPGCKMPNFQLSDVQIKHLVAYLESFK
ncbi:cytochrome c oxidase subunit II [Calycomorphotria hydatis]|uniref:Cytochrome c oxidase subunit 2 n=1 Tax=Calycomorphotria hydatis TaxID=2528027 RepID=A0A517T9A5_9PLAN|nr:cytochrome c oxidase subunit II [Calycomorphotria hydatis]QDT64947.1 Cytochrome c oxidase subunit 2 precursor [Calycomorphotria hydatis]